MERRPDALNPSRLCATYGACNIPLRASVASALPPHLCLLVRAPLSAALQVPRCALSAKKEREVQDELCRLGCTYRCGGGG